MESLEYGVGIVGTDDAISDLERVKLKQIEAQRAASALSAQVRAAEVEASSATGAAGEQAKAKVDALRLSLVRAQATASSYGQQVQQLAERTNTWQSSVAALGPAVGLAGQAVGRFNTSLGQVVTALGSTVSQLPGLITQFGAVGAGIGAVNLAFAAFSIYEQAQRAALEARRADVARLARTFEDLLGDIQRAQAAQNTFDRIRTQGGSAVENQALGARFAAISHQLSQAARGDQAALENIIAQGIPELDIAPGNTRAQSIVDLQGSAWAQANSMATPAQQAEAFVEPLIEALGARIREFRTTRTRQSGANYAASQTGGVPLQEGQSLPERPHGGGGGANAEAAARDAYFRALQEGLDRQQRARDAARDLDASKARTAAQMEIDSDRVLSEQKVAIIEREAEIRQQLLSQQREIEEADRQKAQRREEIDRQKTIRAQEMHAEGMRNVASIGDSALGTLQSGLQSSLSAWLDGTKSFEQAAADMVKGVLKALVSESIVQGIVETARGIAALASYRYDAAALHFAAAGTWAAVGITAGAVGAATGAFGGGGAGASASGGSGKPGRQDRAQASTSNQAPAPITIMMYAPNAVLTEAERASMIARSLRTGERMLGRGAVRIAA